MPDETVDALCRRALTERRRDAFDNVEAERALGIGGHLMRNGRELESFKFGQEIVRGCRTDALAKNVALAAPDRLSFCLGPL